MQHTKAERDFHNQVENLVAQLAALAKGRTIESLTEKYGGGSCAAHLYSIVLLAGHYHNVYEQRSSNDEWHDREDELVRIGQFIHHNLVSQIFVDEGIDMDLVL